MDSLWFLSAGDGLTPVSERVLPGQWDCAAGPKISCAWWDVDDSLLLASPPAGGGQLLDMSIGGLATAAGSRDIQTSMASDGTRLAAFVAGGLAIYALDGPGLMDSFILTDTVSMVWAPNASRLAVVYGTGDQQALAIWRDEDGAFRLVALMEHIGVPTWSPDATKLAFDAVGPAGISSAQNTYSDVYVFDVVSGEVFNLSEMYLNNRDSAEQIGAWAAEWEDDSQAIRYVQGVPAMPGGQVRVRHPLSRRSSTPLWPIADEGLIGIVQRAAEGDWLARIVEGPNGLVLQIARGSDGWQDLVDLPVNGVETLQWLPSSPTDPSAATQSDPRFLLIEEKGIWLVDVDRAAVEKIVDVCATCSVGRAAWLP